MIQVHRTTQSKNSHKEHLTRGHTMMLGKEHPGGVVDVDVPGTSEGDKRAVKSPPLVRRSRLKDGKLSPKWGRTGVTMKFTFLLLRFVMPKQEPATVGFAQNKDTVRF